jgi:hypothetical protein
VIQSRVEQRQSQPVLAATLTAFELVLLRTRLLCTTGELARAVDVIADVDAIGLLLNNVLANADADPATQTAAASALLQVVELCAALQQAVSDDHVPEAPKGKARAAEQSLDLNRGQPSTICTSNVGLSEPLGAPQRKTYAAMSALLQAIVRNVGMPPQSAGEGLLRGGHIVRLSVTTLRAICRAVPCAVWARYALVVELYRLRCGTCQQARLQHGQSNPMKQQTVTCCAF